MGIVARRYAVLDERPQAAALLPRITHPFVRADVCLALARSNIRANNSQAALSWITQAMKLIEQARKIKEKNLQTDGFYYPPRHAEMLKGQLNPKAPASLQSMLRNFSQSPQSNSWSATQLIGVYLGEGKVDFAIQLASVKLKYGNQLLSWQLLAQHFLANGQKERASAMLLKIEEQLPAAQKQAKTDDDRFVIASSISFLANAYSALGNATKANRWFAAFSKDSRPDKKLRMTLGFELAPLLLIEGRTTQQGGFSLLYKEKARQLISHTQRQHAADAALRLWPRLKNLERFNALMTVCASQLAAGERAAAKNSLELLEKAYPSIPEEETDQFPLLQVASGWRRLGEEARVKKLLTPYIASLEADKDTLSIIQSQLETYGFIEEAVALYGKYSQDSANAPALIADDWPYRVSEAAIRFQTSSEFPRWILSIKNKGSRELATSLYVKEITEPLFDSLNEPDLRLQLQTLD
ncbi:hypothetical protein EON83_27400 [bacterium]|nr:MAG: hypothetical protein EON83_27400 [bacterium]